MPVLRLSVTVTAALMLTVPAFGAPATADPAPSRLLPAAAWNGSDPTHVFAFSTYSASSPTARQTFDASVRNCPKRVTKLPAMSQRTARARITAWLGSSKPLKLAVSKFYASRDSRTVAAVRASADAALLSRHPFAAGVATVRWADLAPRDPLALISAATMLTRLGRLVEAQAYLTTAAALKPSTTRGPMGIDTYTQLLNARGYLLLMAGQYTAARQVLTVAVARQPLLAEARTNLSATTMCQKRIPVLNAGRARVKPKPGTPMPADPMKTSGGVPMNLPMARIPETPVDYPGVLIHATWDEATATTESLRLAYEQAGFDAARRPVSPATADRQDYLWSRIFGPEGHYGELYWGIEAELAALDQFWREYSAAPTPPDISDTCTGDDQKQLAWFPRWRSLELAYVQALRARDDARFRFVTGILTNATPEWSRQFVLGEQYRAWVWQSTMVYPRLDWAWYVEPGHCDASPRPLPAAVPAGAELPQFCSATSALKISLNIYVAKVKLNCEQLSLEARTPGWVSAFAKYDYNAATGKVTIFAGARVGGSLGPLTADAKAGMYVSADSTGMTDVGTRAEAKVAAEWGGATLDLGSASSSQSLAGAMEMGP